MKLTAGFLVHELFWPGYSRKLAVFLFSANDFCLLVCPFEFSGQTRQTLGAGLIALVVNSLRERASVLSCGLLPLPLPNNSCADFSSKRLVAFAWDQCSANAFADLSTHSCH